MVAGGAALEPGAAGTGIDKPDVGIALDTALHADSTTGVFGVTINTLGCRCGLCNDIE